MFFFSEESASVDQETVNLFDAKYNEVSYESKVTRLLRHSYARDKENQSKNREWRDALTVLNDEDFYGLDMVDQAGIPRSRALIWKAFASTIPLDLAELAVIAVGFLLVFRPSILGLYLPDWVRWLAYPLLIWLVWYIGRIFGRMLFSKGIKGSKSAEN